MSGKRLFIVLCLAPLLGCGGAEARHESVSTEALVIPESPGTRVEVARIVPTQASLELRIPGEVAGARDALLASAAGGYIERILVTDGQAVTEGQQLARVNTAVYAAQLEQAKAQLELSEAELGRLESLGDLASASQRDSLRTQVRIHKASADLARINLSRSVLKAPFDGVVSQVSGEEGEVASPGTALVRLVQLDPVHVTVSVSDRDVGSLREGMMAQVSAEAVPEVLAGRIIHIDPAADLKTRSFTTEIEVPNADLRLRPGMIASVSVSEVLATGAVVIPQDWLVTRADGVGVFLDEGSVARWRPVQAGALVHDQVVITGGLSEGDRVVITGHRGLAEGDGLLISREGTCCESGRAVFSSQP